MTVLMHRLSWEVVSAPWAIVMVQIQTPRRVAVCPVQVQVSNHAIHPLFASPVFPNNACVDFWLAVARGDR